MAAIAAQGAGRTLDQYGAIPASAEVVAFINKLAIDDDDDGKDGKDGKDGGKGKPPFLKKRHDEPDGDEGCMSLDAGQLAQFVQDKMSGFQRAARLALRAMASGGADNHLFATLAQRLAPYGVDPNEIRAAFLEAEEPFIATLFATADAYLGMNPEAVAHIEASLVAPGMLPMVASGPQTYSEPAQHMRFRASLGSEVPTTMGAMAPAAPSRGEIMAGMMPHPGHPLVGPRRGVGGVPTV